MKHQPSAPQDISGMILCKRCGTLLVLDGDVTDNYASECIADNSEQDILSLAAAILDEEAKSLGAPPPEMTVVPEFKTDLQHFLECLQPYLLSGQQDYVKALTWVSAMSTRPGNIARHRIYSAYISVVYTQLLRSAGSPATRFFLLTLVYPWRARLSMMRDRYYLRLEKDVIQRNEFLRDFETLEQLTMIRIFTYLYNVTNDQEEIFSKDELLQILAITREQLLSSPAHNKEGEQYQAMRKYLNSISLENQR